MNQKLIFCIAFLVIFWMVGVVDADVVDDMTVGYEYITEKTFDNFTVSFYYNGDISYQDWIVTVQNLEEINRDADISSFISKTNFNTDKIENIQFLEYKLIPYSYTVDHYDHVDYFEWNAINQTWNNWTEQFFNYTETVEFEKLDWKACKSNLLTKNNIQLKDDYGEILIPKLYSKDKGDGTINGTKIFRLIYNTPIVKTGDGWGSNGEMSLIIEGVSYCPGWDVSAPFRVGPIHFNQSAISGTQNNFPLQLFINVPGFENYHPVVTVNGTRVPCENESYSNNNLSLFFKANISNITNPVVYVYPSPDLVAADSTYGSQNVWDDNHIVVLHYNQDPGPGGSGSIKDSTSNENHATPHSSMTIGDFIDTPYGKGIEYDGYDDYITWGANSQIINTLSSKSTGWSMHLRINSDSDGGCYICARNSAFDDEVRSSIGSTITSIEYDDDTYGVKIASTVNDYTGSFITISDTIDVNNLKLHINGNLLDTEDVSGVGNLVSMGGVTTGERLSGVGHYSAGNVAYLSGVFDEIRIMNFTNSLNYIITTDNNLNNPTAIGIAPFYNSTGSVEYYISTPVSTLLISPAQYDELDLPLILYILMISMLYLFIAFRQGVAAVELSLIYLIFAFIFLLFQTVTMSVNYIYLILFLLLFLISIAGITKQGAD